MRRALVAALLLCALPAAAAPDWPQSRRDAANSATVELDAPASGRPGPWRFEGSGRVWGYEPGMTVWSPPALAAVAGRAVLAVGSYDRNVYVLDAATGQLLWRHTTGGPVYSAPTLRADGDRVWLYVASSDRLVYALDAASGQRLWIHSVEDYRPTLGGARLSSPVAGTAKGRDAVFVGHWVWDRSLANHLQRGGVIALDARDGRPIWRAPLGDNELTAPVYAGGRLFCGSASGTLYALDADSGRVLWQRAELDAIRSPPAFAETTAGPLVFVASKYGALRALDAATGEERWSWKTGDRITGAPALLAADGVALVVVGSYDRQLHALDPATGALRWRSPARAGWWSSPALARAGGRAVVLASAWDDALHAVALADGAPVSASFTGRPLWNVAGLDESTWSSPVGARVNGVWMAYAGGYDGALRALPLDDAGAWRPPGRSNLAFWLSFPAVVAPLAGLAVVLTRRARSRTNGKIDPAWKNP